MTTTDAHIRRMSAAMSGLLRASTAPQRRIKHGIRAVAWPAPSSSIPFGEPAGTTPGAGAPCSAQRSLHSKGASQEGHTQDAATAPLSTCLSSFTSGPFALTPPADLGPAINTADGGLIIWHTHTQVPAAHFAQRSPWKAEAVAPSRTAADCRALDPTFAKSAAARWP
jgi:hypothetical protein